MTEKCINSELLWDVRDALRRCDEGQAHIRKLRGKFYALTKEASGVELDITTSPLAVPDQNDSGFWVVVAGVEAFLHSSYNSVFYDDVCVAFDAAYERQKHEDKAKPKPKPKAKPKPKPKPKAKKN